MGKVLEFRQKESQEDRITRKMIEIADDIDAVILKHLQDSDVEIKDIAGLLSHRLGTLMNHLEENPSCGLCLKKYLKNRHVSINLPYILEVSRVEAQYQSFY